MLTLHPFRGSCRYSSGGFGEAGVIGTHGTKIGYACAAAEGVERLLPEVSGIILGTYDKPQHFIGGGPMFGLAPAGVAIVLGGTAGSMLDFSNADSRRSQG
jgi:hypothetical protein